MSRFTSHNCSWRALDEGEDAGLIILGRSGVSSELRSIRLADLLRGAVAETVAFHADVPVLIVG